MTLQLPFHIPVFVEMHTKLKAVQLWEICFDPVLTPKGNAIACHDNTKQVVAGVIKTLLILAVATDTGMQFQVSQLQVSANSAQ